MAAAYAALVSLTNTIGMEQRPRYHPHCQICIDDGGLIEALQERVDFLVEFLEEEWKGVENLEDQIVEVAYAAEDAIESYVVHQILPTRDTSLGKEVHDLLCQDLEDIIQEMDSIKNKVVEIKKGKMVGFEDEKTKVLEELIRYDSGRTIISIFGKPGLGKTALATDIFNEELIVQYFNVRAWITVSQKYNIEEILIGILAEKYQGNDENLQKLRYEHLGEQVYKSLSDQRYLVVLDDIWTFDAWNEIKKFFPENGNGSRIVVTTRLPNVAKQISTCSLLMKNLEVHVGKKIAHKSWKDVPELSNCPRDSTFCSNILLLSYSYLPVHLKPCFLYMAVFPHDHKICVTELINLWVAEGFLKPVKGKNLEEIAREYLEDLIEMDLIMVHQRDFCGEIKYCTIHNLVRDLCLTVAEKEKFFCVITSHTPHLPLRMSCHRRFVILLDEARVKECPRIFESLPSRSRPRSLIVNNYEGLSKLLDSPIFSLLRVFYVFDEDYNHTKVAAQNECLSKVLFNLVNLRCLACYADSKFMNILASSISLAGNLQTLVVRKFLYSRTGPPDIWNLPQLRHVAFDDISLAEPPFSEQEKLDYIVLPNLQTLQGLMNFKFEEGILRKICNIKKMSVWYNTDYREHREWSQYRFHNLIRLQKLESLECSFIPSVCDQNELLQNLAFPYSLKKLSLSGCSLLWKDMTVIGSLLHLEVLELKQDSFIGPEWNPVEGEFLHLKILRMCDIGGLINWNSTSTHFPRLEKLLLCGILELKEIPLDIGEIETLGLIQLDNCSDSLVMSAKNILEQQQNLRSDGLLVKVSFAMHSKLSSCSLESKNLLVDRKYQEPTDAEQKAAEEIKDTEVKSISSGETSLRPANKSSKQTGNNAD